MVKWVAGWEMFGAGGNFVLGRLKGARAGMGAFAG